MSILCLVIHVLCVYAVKLLSSVVHKFVKLVTSSVPCKKILHWANVCFGAHAISQPCRPGFSTWGSRTPRGSWEDFQGYLDGSWVFNVWNKYFLYILCNTL